jgi:hypothetical protein
VRRATTEDELLWDDYYTYKYMIRLRSFENLQFIYLHLHLDIFFQFSSLFIQAWKF